MFVEPVAANMGVVAPEPGLPRSAVSSCARATGRCVVFDEVVTGFRVGPHGAQGLTLGRTSTMFGKVLGGGLPIGAVGGRADLMDLLAPVGPVYQAGTYAAHPHAMAAGAAVLDASTPERSRTLEATATRSSTVWLAAAKAAGADASVVRAHDVPVRVLHRRRRRATSPASTRSDRDAFARFHRALRDARRAHRAVAVRGVVPVARALPKPISKRRSRRPERPSPPSRAGRAQGGITARSRNGSIAWNKSTDSQARGDGRASRPPKPRRTQDARSSRRPPARISSASARDQSSTPVPLVPPAKRQGIDEANLVGTWFARAGMLGILIGAGFAFKYAVDRGFIGPTARVALGVVAGLAFIAWGEVVFRRGWTLFSQAVTGGGIALLYLSMLSAVHLFDLIPTEAGFLSDRDSCTRCLRRLSAERTRARGIHDVGGFLNPFLVGASDLDPVVFLAYVAALDVFVLFVAGKLWRPGSCRARRNDLVVIAVTPEMSFEQRMGYSTLLFVMFAAIPFVRHSCRR